MTAGATRKKICFLAVVLCCAVPAAATSANSTAEKPLTSTNALDDPAANGTESANATWCVGHRPSFTVNSSSSAVNVILDEPQGEDQWTCVCAINTLLAPRMKEIACSRDDSVRTPPLCRSVNGSSRTIYIGSLTAETKYTVCVRYLCAGENASAVACQPTTTEPIPKSQPAPPTPFEMTVSVVASSNTANVTWSTSEVAAHGFTVSLWKPVTHSAHDQEPVRLIKTREPHCEFRNLEPYTLYKVEVSTVAPYGGIVANETIFKTQPGAPTAPRNLRLTGISSTAISLEWSAPQGLRGPLFGYTVFYGPAREHQKRSSLETHNTSVTVTHLTPDTFFEVYVKAFNKLHDGTEVASVPARIEVKTSIGAPSKIQNLRVVSRSASTVVVSWSAPLKSNGPLDGYVVHWCNHSSDGHDNSSYDDWMAKLTNHSECHTLKSARETRATVGPLVPESTYVVAVSAYNLQADRHRWIESSPETITVETLPEAPPALRALDVRMVSADSVETNWESPAPGVVGYVVAWCQNQRCSEKTVTATRLIIHNLHADSDYNVSVVPFRMDSQNNKVLGPLTTKQVTVTDSIDAVMADSYLIGTIVCSVIITALGLAVFVVCRRKKGTGPQLYKRMSSLDNDDDDIVFMKTVPRRT